MGIFDFQIYKFMLIVDFAFLGYFNVLSGNYIENPSN